MPTFSSGSTKWTKILNIANGYIDTWQEEVNGDWNSLYTPELNIGVVTTTDTYAIPGFGSTVRKISDSGSDVVRIKHTNGVNYTDYQVVPIDELKNYYAGQNKEYPYGFYCAQDGSNLIFNHKFLTTDPQYGGSINVPVYNFAAHLVNDADVVPVDVPQWLVVMSAAEYVRNDITRQQQYPNLVNEANALMERMKENNEAQIDQVFRPWNPMATTSYSYPWNTKGANGNV